MSADALQKLPKLQDHAMSEVVPPQTELSMAAELKIDKALAQMTKQATQ